MIKNVVYFTFYQDQSKVGLFHQAQLPVVASRMVIFGTVAVGFA